MINKPPVPYELNDPIVRAMQQQLKCKDNTIIRLAAEFGWFCRDQNMSLDEALAQLDQKILKE